MKFMSNATFATVLFILSCVFSNVQSLNLKLRNPLGLKGAPLIGFVNNLHAGLEFFQDKENSKKVFDMVSGPDHQMVRSEMEAFLNKASETMGGTQVPEWVVDRFWNEASKNKSGAVSGTSFQDEMVFAISRDIKDFTADILKEDPTWKYVKPESLEN